MGIISDVGTGYRYYVILWPLLLASILHVHFLTIFLATMVMYSMMFKA